MFNISFGEILIFSIIALIVLGPEKLPQVLRSTAIKYRNIKNAINKVQQDFENELDLIELKKLMENELQKIKDNEANLKSQLEQMQNEIDLLNLDITTPNLTSKIQYSFYHPITNNPYQTPYRIHQYHRQNIVRQVA